MNWPGGPILAREGKLANVYVRLFIIICLIITGCVSNVPPSPTTFSTSSVEERIDAIENHLPVKRWSGWDQKTLIDRMAHYNVPAVGIAVINNDDIEWAKGYGTLEAGSHKPVTQSTLFQAASIGKSLTAAASMHFVEEGYLGLDDNVNAKLVSWKVPENRFTKQGDVTLRRLLSHSAGMTVGGFKGYSEGRVPSFLIGQRK
jgi:CubicO group peptidase (beta-lactamase class C family)